MKMKITCLVLVVCLIASLIGLYVLNGELLTKESHCIRNHILEYDHGPSSVVRFPMDNYESDFSFGEMASLIRALSNMGPDMNINGFYYMSPFVRVDGNALNCVAFLPELETVEVAVPELVLTCLTTDQKCTFDDNEYHKRNHPILYDSEQVMEWINGVEQGSRISIWADANTSFRSLAGITTLLKENRMEVAWGEPQAQTNCQEHAEVRLRVDSSPYNEAPWVIMYRF